jgi:hypothetical protein
LCWGDFILLLALVHARGVEHCNGVKVTVVFLPSTALIRGVGITTIG